DRAADEALLAVVRSWAVERLPGYMVPPTLTVLEELPLSANGKIDRTALPDPTTTTSQSTGRRAELGPTAAKLAAIAAEVIGIPDIDPHGDFFTLGGDSIMGVQLVSRAGAEGMEIMAADLFRHRTIAELAAVVDQRREGEETASDGLLPLSPFQREIFARSAPEVPTAVQQFTIPVDPSFDPDTAGRVLALLLGRHPGLRMRFVQGEDGWGQTDTGWSEHSAAQAAHVPLIDLSALPGERRERTVRQMAAEMRDEFDPTTGPLVKVALFDLGPDRRRLLWLSHLLVADLRSLQVLLGEFSAAAGQLRDGDRADLLPPTRPFPRWVERAAGHTAEAEPSDGAVPLPAGSGEGPVHRLSTVLEEDEAGRLLSAAADAYRLSGREVALAALASAAFAGTGQERIRLGVEDDARPLALGDLDVSGSVGSFGRAVPVVLERHGGEDIGALLTEVKERLRAAVRQDPLPVPPPGEWPLLLRDLDALAELPRLGHPFSPDGPVAPPAWDPGNAPGHPLVVTTYRLAGRWHIDWLCRGDDARALAELLAGHVTEALRAIAEHCTAAGAGAVSPSDFPLADLDPAALAALTASLNGAPPGGGAGPDPNDGTTTEVIR
ncbi:condensation domain-containing protein, partial [Streptomyces nanhaiensis]|uniref:condensation domain-containing protein n=1 Tax=Streptomyces nanhaiensis TaxID=679319 RepID=UPI00399CD82B